MPLDSQRQSIPAKHATRFLEKCDLSIHPRNWPDRIIGVLRWKERRKLNTSKPRSTARIHRAIAGIEKHLKAHPHDGKSAARLADLKAL